MLSHKNRFHGHGSLRYVFKNGETVRGRYLVLRYLDNPNRKHTRVAVVVSKKIYKHAVRRNRIRRRIYDIVRHKLPSIEGVHDIAIIVTSPETYSMPHDQLTDQVDSLLRDAGLYKTSI
jgi:ribonuclease P protein component